MNSLPVLVVVTFVIFMTSWTQGEAVYCKDTDTAAEDAAMNAMRKCNSLIKYCYDEHDLDEGYILGDVYCFGMKTLLKCAKEEEATFQQNFPCVSHTLEDWLLVSSEYARIGKVLGIHDTQCNYEGQYLGTSQGEFLGDLITRFENKDTRFSGTDTTGCAKAIHEKCAKDLVAYEDDDRNLCHSVNNFVSCYRNAVVKTGDVPEQCANVAVPTISKTFFSNVIIGVSEKLIAKYSGQQLEIMCKAQEGDWEGEENCFAIDD